MFSLITIFDSLICFREFVVVSYDFEPALQPVATPTAEGVAAHFHWKVISGKWVSLFCALALAQTRPALPHGVKLMYL